jgi:hypothetical protein
VKFYGDKCLSRTQVFEWFKEGGVEIGDDQRPGCLSTSEKEGKFFNKIVA